MSQHAVFGMTTGGPNHPLYATGDEEFMRRKMEERASRRCLQGPRMPH